MEFKIYDPDMIEVSPATFQEYSLTECPVPLTVYCCSLDSTAQNISLSWGVTNKQLTEKGKGRKMGTKSRYWMMAGTGDDHDLHLAQVHYPIFKRTSADIILNQFLHPVFFKYFKAFFPSVHRFPK